MVADVWNFYKRAYGHVGHPPMTVSSDSFPRTTRRTLRWCLFLVLGAGVKLGQFYLCVFGIHFFAQLVAAVARDFWTNSDGIK